ncbi:MAG TPA: putative baseplate assembly protein [Pyrinomonadaceae bacterium]|nr:putative baseplate assembly protein [Pyrinomonadaceae bacterium]
MSEETKQLLNDCGCCEGVAKETPESPFNRPGLSEIAYRVGTYAQFRETLQARLSGSDQPALRALTTRDANDFSMALLDAWAVVSDVLSFYQERIANEAYLRTATERLSVLELARLIGYELRPGVAANAYLAFTLEDAAGALGQVLAVGTTAQAAPETLPPITIDTGTKVQSVPGPGEQAQTFETVQPVEARPEWNAIKPRLTQPQTVSSSMQVVVLQGANNNVKAGDQVLIVDGTNAPAVKSILKVTVDEVAKTTRLELVSTPETLPYKRPQLFPAIFRDFLFRTELRDTQARQIINTTWRAADLSAVARIQLWNPRALAINIRRQLQQPSLLDKIGVFAFRDRASIFGHNAPRYKTLLKAGGGFLYDHDWDNGFEIWKDPNDDKYYTDADVYLERTFAGVTKGQWAVLELSTSNGPSFFPYTVAEVNEASLAGFGISGKSTGLRLASGSGAGLGDNATDKKSQFEVRKTTALINSEQLPLAELPISDLIEPASVVTDGITLDGIYLGLNIGQRVILSGERTDLSGVFASEALTLKDVVVEGGFTLITFAESLVYTYLRTTVTINANVAPATHGETVQETLGGGDGTQTFQKFVLRHPPLTYVSSADPSGASSTLEVRVNDVLWHEVPDFYGHEPQERIYVTRRDDQGNTTVIFGDGKTGARLPTGQENVTAKYRKGIGLGGLVKHDQLTQLMTRPLGVKSVTNPIAPSGAADPEILADAKQNAPLTILTLGRVVSLRDYEDFARAFSGIGKALATSTWFGETRGVFVTVAGANGADVADPGVLHTNLVNAIQSSGDSLTPVLIKSYSPRFFRVTAQLKINPDYLAANVLAAAEKSLREAFSFDSRAFGQPVHLSEVVGVLQDVTGVLAVNVTALYRSDEDSDRLDHIAAALPLVGGTDTFPAELLTLDPRPVDLGTFA